MTYADVTAIACGQILLYFAADWGRLRSQKMLKNLCQTFWLIFLIGSCNGQVSVFLHFIHDWH